MQEELEKILRQIPTVFGDTPHRDTNLDEVIRLARLLTQSKGTRSSTEYILKKAARSFEMGLESPIDRQTQNPESELNFPGVLVDEEGGLFSTNPTLTEAKLLKSAIYSCEESGRFITRWREEFRQNFNVAYESVVGI